MAEVNPVGVVIAGKAKIDHAGRPTYLKQMKYWSYLIPSSTMTRGG